MAFDPAKCSNISRYFSQEPPFAPAVVVPIMNVGNVSDARPYLQKCCEPNESIAVFAPIFLLGEYCWAYCNATSNAAAMTGYQCLMAQNISGADYLTRNPPGSPTNVTEAPPGSVSLGSTVGSPSWKKLKALGTVGVMLLALHL